MTEQDVRIKINIVGINGSDLHYYTHGSIGPLIVSEPMVLGHQAAGTGVEVGSEVTILAVEACFVGQIAEFCGKHRSPIATTDH